MTMMPTGVSIAVLLLYLASLGNAFHLQSLDVRSQTQCHVASLREDESNVVSDPSRPDATVDRRTALTWGCATISAITLLNPSLVLAVSDDTMTLAPITHKVFMDVRISRSDGTFYVRDDLPDIPENKVFSGRLVLGLFGTKAPTAVDRFLSYVVVPLNPLDDNPLPSYGRSSFKSLDQSTGK